MHTLFSTNLFTLLEIAKDVYTYNEIIRIRALKKEEAKMLSAKSASNANS